MNILRRLFLTLCGVALGFALLATAWAHIGVATIGNRNTVKTWLDESGFYDNVVNTVLETASKEQAKNGEAQIPVDNPQIQAVAQNAFSPAFLQENVEKFLDGTYAWLEGETPKPEFVIDLSNAKQQLADGLSNYAVSRAASLPACTTEQMAAMSDGYDALSAPCVPPGADVQAAAAELKNDILTSDGFLNDPTFSGEDFKIEENGQQVSIGDSEFRRAQNAYKLASYGPYIFGVLSVLLAVAVFFLSSSKRRGLKRVGIILVISGTILGLSFVAFNSSESWLSSWAEDLSGETNAGKVLAAGLVRAINDDISGLLGWYALAFLALGIGAILFSVFYKRKGKNLKQSTEPEPPTDDTPKIVKKVQTDKPEAKKIPVNEAKKPKPVTKIQL